jgi:hypothetical protein
MEVVWPGGRYNHYIFDLNRDGLGKHELEAAAISIV